MGGSSPRGLVKGRQKEREGSGKWWGVSVGPEEGRLGRAGDIGLEEGHLRYWGRSVVSEGRRGGTFDGYGDRVGKAAEGVRMRAGYSKVQCLGM